MNTAEMWLEAQVDGRMYRCPQCQMLYSKNSGLINDDDNHYRVYLDEFDCTFNEFMSYEWWIADDVLTIEEAEKRLGAKIIQGDNT